MFKLSKGSAIQPEAKSSTAFAQRPFVLLVDDEDEFREEFALLLARRGCQVQTAANGAAALQVLAADRCIEIMITDLRMPDMDGLALIEQVRQDRASHDYIGFIIVTGHGDFLNLAIDVLNPNVTLLQKPVAIPTLMEHLATIAAHVRRERNGAK